MPEVSVSRTLDNQEVPLQPYEDYEFSYSENVNVGTAIVTITGKGNYVGRLTANFNILPREISVTNTSIDTKVYDGTLDATVDTAVNPPAIKGLAGSDTLVFGKDIIATAKFTDPNAGEDKEVIVSFELADTALAKNYKLANNEITAKGTITQAQSSNFSSSLTVWNDKAAEYRIDLSSVIPDNYLNDLDASIEISEVSLPNNYYNAATQPVRVEGATLILPVQQADSTLEGSIGTITVKLSSNNYESSVLVIDVLSKNHPASNDSVVPDADGNKGSTPSTGDTLPVSLVFGLVSISLLVLIVIVMRSLLGNEKQTPF